MNTLFDAIDLLVPIVERERSKSIDAVQNATLLRDITFEF